MQQLFSHYEQDFNQVCEKIKTSLPRYRDESISHDERILLIEEIENDLEEAKAIIQQLEFSSQNSGINVKPKITSFNNAIREFIKELESLTGQESNAGKKKVEPDEKIQFDNITINNLDHYTVEEDLNDLREIMEYEDDTEHASFTRFLKKNKIKVAISFGIAILITIIIIVLLKVNQ
ncbi:hypothetical protein DFA_03350 [Cavenderia fasciculata]|uniref:Vesicle transport v-SNARE N-terminal domain-containing protein n=1 Tax=Cavenderia fasciculata TaxID=261658 RepID=F4PHC0_CACFS|nr:uncharacterized protein DFA_03350 [Cavenderia fasciculata]EGG25104.1 hypothetical protein DFA_03350 [Cavenderia fasciculata]|eukprot:XP_004362955.1 hypothetical protein DFA_03350 [Cavenderia fasciculata]